MTQWAGAVAPLAVRSCWVTFSGTVVSLLDPSRSKKEMFAPTMNYLSEVLTPNALFFYDCAGPENCEMQAYSTSTMTHLWSTSNVPFASYTQMAVRSTNIYLVASGAWLSFYETNSGTKHASMFLEECEGANATFIDTAFGQVVHCNGNRMYWCVTDNVLKTAETNAPIAAVGTYANELYAVDMRGTLYMVRADHFLQPFDVKPNYIAPDATSAADVVGIVAMGWQLFVSSRDKKVYVIERSTGRRLSAVALTYTPHAPFVAGSAGDRVFVSTTEGWLFGIAPSTQQLLVDRGNGDLGLPAVSDSTLLFANDHGVFVVSVKNDAPQILWSDVAPSGSKLQCRSPHIHDGVAYALCRQSVRSWDLLRGTPYMRSPEVFESTLYQGNVAFAFVSTPHDFQGIYSMTFPRPV